MAMVCTAVGMAAMLVAPAARPSSKVADDDAGARATPGADARSATRDVDMPGWIQADHSRAFVYPPQHGLASPQPVTVVLHGMCGEPLGVCAPFVGGSTARGWLVCPKAQDACGGGSRWRFSGSFDAQAVEASVGELARERTGEVDLSAPRVIVGFSLGGILAVRMAESQSEHARYTGLVVIASQVQPDAARLKKAGVVRVILAAGDYDMTSKPLQDSARALSRAGLATRFVSLGAYGHGYPADMEERMREPMQWVDGV
jgi:alpha-beta hydrolase superfamily lysophospholipase